MKPHYLFLTLLAAPAMAYEPKALTDPTVQAILKTYNDSDRALVTSPTAFTLPAARDWPCTVSDEVKYATAGLYFMIPAQKKDIDKALRKALRQIGLGAAPNETYSNIVVIPLAGQCKDGQLDGDVDVFVSYDSERVFENAFQTGEKIIHSKSVTRSTTVQRMQRRFVDGELQTQQRMFFKMTATTDNQYDDAAMQEMEAKNKKLIGQSTPTIMTLYTSENGTSVSIMETEEAQISAGLFGVNKSMKSSLTTSFTLPLDEHHKLMEMYKDGALIGVNRLKDHTAHGESLVYMDNYLKKIGQRIDQAHGMEDTREITINGKDLLEKRTCWQNGQIAKIDPCPAD